MAPVKKPKRGSFFDEYTPANEDSGDTVYVRKWNYLTPQIRKRELKTKLFRETPITHTTQDATGTRVYTLPRAVKPKIPKLINKWDVEDNPQKYTSTA